MQKVCIEGDVLLVANAESLFLLVSVCCDTAQALVFMLVAGNVLWHSPSLGVHAGVSVL